MRRSWIIPLAASCLIAGSPALEAQDRVSEFSKQPLLVLNTGAHHAPVRRLIFTPDERQLLSAGDDKVVLIWDLDPIKLSGTIRPPIWRAWAGQIKAMALSKPDAKGVSTLATAGKGFTSDAGEIGLYRYPGAAALDQGDIKGYLPSLGGPQGRGHLDTVNALAFDPDGGLLASASNDGRVILWDVRANTRAVPIDPSAPGAPRPVNALAFTPDGKDLLVGGDDGYLRVFSVERAPARLQLVAQAAPANGRRDDPGGVAINPNALGVSPDGRWAVIGREDGYLARYDLKAQDLAASVRFFATRADQGPVEALTFAADGRLATSIVSRRIKDRGEMPTLACDIELRRVDDLDFKEPVEMATSNLVYALAFSPKGSYLAFGGGNRQDIKLKDLRDRNLRLVEVSNVSAKGASVWDVGFLGDGPNRDGGLALVYSQDPPNRPVPTYQGFNLRDRAAIPPNPPEVSRAITTYDGWTVRPVGPYILDVLKGAGGYRIPLSRTETGRWFSYSFIPPGPGHPVPTFAVACDTGVVIHRLSDNVRTRFLDGHAGAVYCLAPSADGRWLATGSSDQTVRLWTLAGCDTVPPLGVVFDRVKDTLVVKSVEKGSFGDLAGLKVDTILDRFGLDKQQVTIDAFLKGRDASPPNVAIEFLGQRPGVDAAAPAVLFANRTSKRDRPVLSMFVGLDRQWAIWMPQGFYDSSVDGDDKYLGWQVNRTTLDLAIPTDFFPLRTHAETLRQIKFNRRNRIDRLLDAADILVALEDVPVDKPPVEVKRPVSITARATADPGVIRAVAAGDPIPTRFVAGLGAFRIDWRFQTGPNAPPPGPVVLRVGTLVIRPSSPPAMLDPAQGLASVVATYADLTPGTHVLSATAFDKDGAPREEYLTVTVEGPPPPPPRARLHLVAMAPTFANPKIPKVDFADNDVNELAPFLAKHLVGKAGETFPPANPAPAVLTGAGATEANFLKALADLGQGPITPGDMAVVVIESHVRHLERNGGKDIVIQAHDSAEKDGIPAQAVTAALETIANQGCEVIVVIDGVHSRKAGRGVVESDDTLEWTRELKSHRISAILTSTRGPVDVKVNRHRVLAWSILQTINNRPDEELIRVAGFEKLVRAEFSSSTNKKGEPEFYYPVEVDQGDPRLEPTPDTVRPSGPR